MKLFCLVLVTVVATGCTTLADSIASKGTGKYKVYEKTKEEVWPVAKEAVSSVGLKLISAQEKSDMILAQRGVTFFSYGENVAIFVEEAENNTCRVEVVSKKSMETNIFAPDWSNSIFRYLDNKL